MDGIVWIWAQNEMITSLHGGERSHSDTDGVFFFPFLFSKPFNRSAVENNNLLFSIDTQNETQSSEPLNL
jgi:hypothetical protein